MKARFKRATNLSQTNQSKTETEIEQTQNSEKKFVPGLQRTRTLAPQDARKPISDLKKIYKRYIEKLADIRVKMRKANYPVAERFYDFVAMRDI